MIPSLLYSMIPPASQEEAPGIWEYLSVAFRGDMNLFAERLLMERRGGMSLTVWQTQEGQHLPVALPGCSIGKLEGPEH